MRELIELIDEMLKAGKRGALRAGEVESGTLLRPAARDYGGQAWRVGRGE